MSFNKWFDRLFERKQHLHLPLTFSKSDVIPLVFRAFPDHFARVGSNLKAIEERMGKELESSTDAETPKSSQHKGCQRRS